MSNQTNSQYFNLIADGCGFLNRPRIVQTKGKNSSYFSATIAANRGDAGETTRFEVRIVGGEAKELFQKLLDEYPALLDKDFKKRPSVFVSFRIGDIQPMKFNKDGKETLYIDGRVIKFNSIFVNKQKWFPKPEQSTEAKADEQPQAKAA